MSDDYHELGSGFNYIGEGGELHYISGGDIEHNTAIYGNVLKFNSDDTVIIVEQAPSYEAYKSRIGFDLSGDYYRYHDFVTDSSEWKKEWPEKEVREIRKFAPLYDALKIRGTSFEDNAADRMKCEVVADSLLHSQPYYQNIFRNKRNYWIIDKKLNTGYGPYGSLQFNRECKRRGIGIELEAHY